MTKILLSGCYLFPAPLTFFATLPIYAIAIEMADVDNAKRKLVSINSCSQDTIGINDTSKKIIVATMDPCINAIKITRGPLTNEKKSSTRVVVNKDGLSISSSLFPTSRDIKSIVNLA